ncbi:hypothetical protein IEQ34_007592 [Dendrobium chrysotoxum]|uniref:Uncharacterized protein n=1 Tax=Dendrobium chrysotoxum TaxID=161865 RepID=A0AAV7H644_DENCH|nr:hypothetical protein IEQ34_007592 [Dendrobium chrysotoxum]
MKREERNEEEEEKMKKFFLLMENIRATRILWQTAPTKRQKRESSLWQPAFEWEDFLQAESSNTKDGGISGGNKRKKEEGRTDSCVDLRLGL